MRCISCEQKAVYGNPAYCKDHFISYVEGKVKKTIKDFGLIEKGDRIVVAASGGKDSLTVLHIINKLHGKRSEITALVIDEGISGYRERTIEDLKRFCEKEDISLRVVSMRQEFGKSLDELIRMQKGDGSKKDASAKVKSAKTEASMRMKQKDEPVFGKENIISTQRDNIGKACTLCGTARRFLINKHARELGATKLVTGHNMDDEAQAILMNLFMNNLELSARLGPMTGITDDRRFVPRIKPLYFCAEKEIMAYSILMGFGVSFAQCPYTGESYRNSVQELLNEYEQKHAGAKRNIIENFLKALPALKEHYATGKKPSYCKHCGEPSRGEVCRVCRVFGQR